MLLVPEHDVVGAERLAVRPLHALAQKHLPLGEVVVGLPALGDVGDDLGAVGRIAHQGIVDDARVVVVIRGAEEAAAQGAAVGADRLDHLLDQRLLGQALVHRRQIAGLDHRGQHRRLVVLGLRHGGPLAGRRQPDDQRQAADQKGMSHRFDAHCSPPGSVAPVETIVIVASLRCQGDGRRGRSGARVGSGLAWRKGVAMRTQGGSSAPIAKRGLWTACHPCGRREDRWSGRATRAARPMLRLAHRRLATVAARRARSSKLPAAGTASCVPRRPRSRSGRVQGR